MNLITKLTEKLKAFGYKLSESAKALLDHIHINGNNKIGKKIATLALCSVMAFSIGTMTACNNTPTVDPGTSTVQPGGNENLKQYSQILQTVLTDSYYTKLADEIGAIGNLSQTQYRPAPYTFLQKQGHDVENLKNNNLYLNTTIYIKGSDKSKLYCNLIVENTAEENYNTNYVLSYDLTEKEYNDLEMLYNGNYIQASLFFQELDHSKTAKILSSKNIVKESYDAIVKRMTSNTTLANCLNSNKITSVILLDFSVGETDTNTMKLLIGDYYASSKNVNDAQNGIVEYSLAWNSGASVNNDIFKLITPNRTNLIDKSAFINSIENVTKFTLPVTASKQFTLE